MSTSSMSSSSTACVMGFDLGEHRLDVGELALDGQREGSDGAFHPLEDVDAHQVDQALLAIDLPEDSSRRRESWCCISRRRPPACAAARSEGARMRRASVAESRC